MRRLWALSISLVVVYNVGLTVFTWAFLKHNGLTAQPLSPAPIALAGLGATLFQAALWKLGMRGNR